MQKSGAWGEEIAALFLKSKGYRLLDKNFRIKAGEIDIIAKDGGCTVFIEVKTRKSANFGTPSEFVNSAKQRRIRTAAMAYISSLDTDMRFDVIEVYYSPTDSGFKLEKINHIENAFQGLS